MSGVQIAGAILLAWGVATLIAYRFIPEDDPLLEVEEPPSNVSAIRQTADLSTCRCAICVDRRRKQVTPWR